MLPQPGLLQDYAQRGVLKPLDDVIGDEVDANYTPSARDIGTVDGTLYALWWKGAQKSTVWYNLHVFEEAGVSPPATFDELQQVAQTIADSGTPPYSIGGADGWTLSDLFENIYIRVAGADMYDQLAKHEIPWTDQTVKDSLTVMAEVVGNPDLIAGGTNGALQTDFNTSITQCFADPPKAAIILEQDVVGGIASDEANAELGTDIDFFDFPTIEDSPTAVVGGGDLGVLLTDNEAAKALLEFLGTPEAATTRVELGGFISPNKNVETSSYPDEITRRAAEAWIAAGDEVRYDLSDQQPAAFGATTGQGIWGLFQEFIRNPNDVDGTAQKLEDAAAKAFG
jgi:hypothetical protein